MKSPVPEICMQLYLTCFFNPKSWTKCKNHLAESGCVYMSKNCGAIGGQQDSLPTAEQLMSMLLVLRGFPQVALVWC